MGKLWLLLRPCSVVPMDSGAASAAHSSGADAEMRAPAGGVLDELSGALASARGALSSFLDLISLEARRAGLAIMWMAVLGGVAAICLVAAWLGLMVAFAMWAVSLGVHLLAAVIAVALINGVAGVGLIYACIGMSRDLLFSATRRQLAGMSSVTPTAP